MAVATSTTMPDAEEVRSARRISDGLMDRLNATLEALGAFETMLGATLSAHMDGTHDAGITRLLRSQLDALDEIVDDVQEVIWLADRLMTHRSPKQELLDMMRLKAEGTPTAEALASKLRDMKLMPEERLALAMRYGTRLSREDAWRDLKEISARANLGRIASDMDLEEKTVRQVVERLLSGADPARFDPGLSSVKS